MKGYLQSKGFKVSESRVAKSLQCVAPEQYESRRQNTLDRVNPVGYVALYFGHKLHIDQNEKLKNHICNVERCVGWSCILNCFMLSSLPCFYAFC